MMTDEALREVRIVVPGLQGPLGLNWRENWSDVTAYLPRDGVYHDGSAWIALAPSTDVEPGTDGAVWSLFASGSGDSTFVTLAHATTPRPLPEKLTGLGASAIDFGAAGDGVTDDLAAWLDMITRLGGLGYDKYEITGEGRTYAFSDTFRLPDGAENFTFKNFKGVPIGVAADWEETDARTLTFFRRYQTYATPENGLIFPIRKPLIDYGHANPFSRLENFHLDCRGLSAGVALREASNNRALAGLYLIENVKTYGLLIGGSDVDGWPNSNVITEGQGVIRGTNSGPVAVRDQYCIAHAGNDAHIRNIHASYAHATLLFAGATTSFEGCDFFNGLSAEGVDEPDFNPPVDEWTLGANWSVVDGAVRHTPGATASLQQAITGLIPGRTYRVVFTIRNRGAGSIRPQFLGGPPVNGAFESNNGTFTQYLTAVAGNTDIALTPSSDFDGDIDDVSLKIADNILMEIRGGSSYWVGGRLGKGVIRQWNFDFKWFPTKHALGRDVYSGARYQFIANQTAQDLSEFTIIFGEPSSGFNATIPMFSLLTVGALFGSWSNGGTVISNITASYPLAHLTKGKIIRHASFGNGAGFTTIAEIDTIANTNTMADPANAAGVAETVIPDSDWATNARITGGFFPYPFMTPRGLTVMRSAPADEYAADFGHPFSTDALIKVWGNDALGVLTPEWGLRAGKMSCGFAEAQGLWTMSASGQFSITKTFSIASSGALTVASGSVTAIGSVHSVDTEAGAATDDLDTINGLANGDQLTLQGADPGRKVTVRHGTGNLFLPNGDFTFIDSQARLTFRKSGQNWIEYSRSGKDSGTVTALAGHNDATLNYLWGIITTDTLSTAAGAAYSFTLSNNKIAATDRVSVEMRGDGSNTQGIPIFEKATPGSGSVVIVIRNMHATAALNGTLKFGFRIEKA